MFIHVYVVELERNSLNIEDSFSSHECSHPPLKIESALKCLMYSIKILKTTLIFHQKTAVIEALECDRRNL